MDDVASIACSEGSATSDDADRAARFRTFCVEVEPRLRRGLVAAYGVDVGSDASAEAMTWAWQHFARVEAMDNPAGYLWRVGQSASRRELRHRGRRSARSWEAAVEQTLEFEPGLPGALGSLSTRQRTAVLLVHGYGYSLADAAQIMGCRIRTLRNHLERGMAKLRTELGVINDA